MTGAVRISPSAVTVPAAGASVEAAEILLGGTPRGAVIVVHDQNVRSMDVVEVMNDLAGHGYESVVLSIVTPTDAVRRIAAVATYLAGRRRLPDSIGLLGFGAGGPAVLAAAGEARFGAAVSVSPTDGLSAAEAAEWLRRARGCAVRTPWLGLFGAQNDAVIDGIRHFVDAVAANSPVHVEIVTYRNVDPDFYRHAGDNRAHAAAFESWQRAIEWFNLQVVPPLTPLAKASLAGSARAAAGACPEEEE